MSCNTCYKDTICLCLPYESEIFINTIVPDANYDIVVTHHTGNKYEATATRGGDGRLSFNKNDFPDGLFDAPGNKLLIEIFPAGEDHCASIKMPMTSFYDCIEVEVIQGNIDSDEIGCSPPIS